MSVFIWNPDKTANGMLVKMQITGHANVEYTFRHPVTGEIVKTPHQGDVQRAANAKNLIVVIADESEHF